MIRKVTAVLAALLIVSAVALTGCGSSNTSSVPSSAETTNVDTSKKLSDGVYDVYVETDSPIFHINETTGGYAKLTVKDGEMSVHIPMVSQNIRNVYLGTAIEAAKLKENDERIINPTEEVVEYSDGTKEIVLAFDIPVEHLNSAMDVAVRGPKGKWFNQTLWVFSPGTHQKDANETTIFDDATYYAKVKLEGGTGRVYIESPATVREKNGEDHVLLEWSSPNYAYMIVNGETYEPANKTDSTTTFDVPFPGFDKPTKVKACTTAMSEPHEIEYTITFKK